MKKCPYCFTELDDRATVCSHCRKKVSSVGKDGIAKKRLSGCFVLLLVIFGIIFGGTIISIIISRFIPGVEKKNTEYAKGSTGYLVSKTSTTVLIASEKKYLYEGIDAAQIEDKYGLFKLISEGKISLVDNGKEVMILDETYEFDVGKVYKVRILEGKNFGEVVFILKEDFTPHISDIYKEKEKKH